MKYLYEYLIFSFFCFAIVLYGMRRKYDVCVEDILYITMMSVLPGFNLFVVSLWIWDIFGEKINLEKFWKMKVLKKKN